MDLLVGLLSKYPGGKSGAIIKPIAPYGFMLAYRIGKSLPQRSIVLK